MKLFKFFRLARDRCGHSGCRSPSIDHCDACGLPLCAEHRFRFVAPPHHLCTDNAVMIAWAGLERMALGMPSDDLTVAPRSRWPLDQDAKALLAYGKRGAKA